MRAAEGVHIEWVDEEAVILDPETERLHYLNPTTALFYALILESGYNQAVIEMGDRFSDVEELQGELERVTAQLVEEGLLTDD